MYLKEKGSLTVPPMNEKYTTYQVLIDIHVYKGNVLFAYFNYFNKPIYVYKYPANVVPSNPETMQSTLVKQWVCFNTWTIYDHSNSRDMTGINMILHSGGYMPVTHASIHSQGNWYPYR